LAEAARGFRSDILPNDVVSRRSAAKLALEGVVVVVSILIAFALDAWWNERKLEQETAEDLSVVQFELAENIRLIRGTTAVIDQVLTANDVLIEELLGQPDGALVAVGDTTALWGLFTNPTLDLSFGATDAWIADGRLGALSSPMLRQRLASLRGKVGDVLEEQQVAREISVGTIYPLIMDDIGSIAAVDEIVRKGLGARQRTSVQEIPVSEKINLPNSNALRFLLRSRSLWYESSKYEIRDFEIELEEIRGLLQEEMQRLGEGQVVKSLGPPTAD